MWNSIFHSIKIVNFIKIATFTLFSVVFHSKTCCPVFNSSNEWKLTRLHLQNSARPKLSKMVYGHFSDRLKRKLTSKRTGEQVASYNSMPVIFFRQNNCKGCCLDCLDGFGHFFFFLVWGGREKFSRWVVTTTPGLIHKSTRNHKEPSKMHLRSKNDLFYQAGTKSEIGN